MTNATAAPAAPAPPRISVVSRRKSGFDSFRSVASRKTGARNRQGKPTPNSEPTVPSLPGTMLRTMPAASSRMPAPQ